MPTFYPGLTVTDGDCAGTVTRVFTSFDDLGNGTPCLSVRIPKTKSFTRINRYGYKYTKYYPEDFLCTRADWWKPTQQKG